MEIDEIYKNIAVAYIKGMGNDVWEKIIINIEAYENRYADFSGYCMCNGEKKYLKLSMEVISKLMDDIFELQGLMGESNKWNKAVFTLFPSGKFDMDFKWDEERDAERKARLKEYEEKTGKSGANLPPIPE